MGVLKLKGVSLETLKELFEIMSKVKKSSTVLNFTINKEKLTGVGSNDSKAVYKYWEIPTKNISEAIDGDVPLGVSLKVSILNGSDFSKKILSFFGQMADLEFHHDNNQVDKIVITKYNKEGKKLLTIPVVCSRTSLTFEEEPQEILDIIFGLTPDFNPKSKFEIRKEDIINIRKLSSLNSNTEEQKKYIKIYSEEGTIKATDNAFDVVLTPNTSGYADEIEIDKSLLGLIDPEEYDVFLNESHDLKFIIMNRKSELFTQKISVNLLSEIDDDTTWEDFAADDFNF